MESPLTNDDGFVEADFLLGCRQSARKRQRPRLPEKMGAAKWLGERIFQKWC
jgi:hypothetical protein